MKLDLASFNGRLDTVCKANRRVKDDSRLWGDDVLREFDYTEVRNGSITRQAQKVKSNCLKMFLFHYNTETREHIIYAQHQQPDKREKNISRDYRPSGFPSNDCPQR